MASDPNGRRVYRLYSVLIGSNINIFIRHRNNRIEIVPCNDFFAIFASELALIKLFKDFKFLQKSINV